MIHTPPPTRSAHTGNGLDLAGIPRGPEFIADGLCAQTDPEIFHPEKGGSTKEAKRVCSTCPVEVACLDWAISTQQRFGIWGGKSERERRKLQKEQAA